MDVQGKVKLIKETETVGNNGFTKRDIVITTEEQYPQDILIQFVKDKTELLNAYKVGQDVKISINLRGREWTSPQGDVKYFNTIQGWRIEGLASQETPTASPAEAFEPATNLKAEAHDDLPF